MDDLILEKKLKEVLNRKAGEVPGGALASQRIRTGVFKTIEEAENMRHRNWKKVAVVTAAICIFGTMTAIAVGRPAFVISGSSRNDVVTEYETAVKQQKEYDGRVKAVEAFSNGYTFKEAVPRHEETQDEGGNLLGQGMAMSFTYEKEGMEDVEFSGSRLTAGMDEGNVPDQAMTLEDGTELKFSKTVNKFVPPDYEITEEERKLQEEGKLNVAYGSDEVEVINSTIVLWEQDGIAYSLFAFGDGLGAEEMLGMAREIAEQ